MTSAPSPGTVRALMLPALVAGLGWVGIAILDWEGRIAAVSASGRLDAPLFKDFSPLQDGGFRVAHAESQLVIGGLWTGAPVTVTVRMSLALRGAQVVSVWANEILAHRQDLGGRPGMATFRARADEGGRLRLRWTSESPATAVGVYEVSVVRAAKSGLGRARSLLYASFLLVCTAIGAWWRRTRGASG